MRSPDSGAPLRPVQRYLAGHFPEFGPIREIRTFPGGQSNSTHLVTTAGGRFVLRIKPSGVLLPSAPAVDREYRVLRAICQGAYRRRLDGNASSADNSQLGAKVGVASSHAVAIAVLSPSLIAH